MEKTSILSKIKNLSVKKLAIIITAAVVALILLVFGIISTVNYITNDEGFDYLKSNLKNYIEFTEDYRNFDLNIDIAKPRDIDIDITILNMLREDKPTKAWLKESKANLQINPGDVVYIYYRGYLVDAEGNKTEQDGMCNFADANPYGLEIGSNGFVPGFELDLWGHKTGDSVRFEKITSGSAANGTVAYVTYKKVTTNENNTTSTTTVSASNPKRIDYSAEDIATLYGEGFLEKVQSLNIGTKSTGEFKTQVDGKDVTYTDITVQYVTTCEAEGNYIEVSCYFPYDYGNATLNNKDAIFEVYIQYADFYYPMGEAPVFDDDYLKKKIEDKDISVTLEKLDEYEGETYVDKYKAYATELMNELYETEKKSMIESAIWERYSSIAKIKKYPTARVDEVYYDYANEINNLYITNGGRIYNSYYGSYDTYDTLNAYANAYLGIDSYSEWYVYGETAWQYSLYQMAQDFVKERLVLYYIMRYENILPSEEELNAKVESIKQEYLDEYIQQYLDNESKTKDDYTAEEWEKFQKLRALEIFSYYDNNHFEERAYYTFAAETLITWPNVKTLDDSAEVQ